MFITPLFQLENFPYAIIPEKKEQIIPLKTSAYSITLRHKMALFHSYNNKKKPLFLLHYSSSPPKVEPVMLSLSESESIVIFPYSATGW